MKYDSGGPHTDLWPPPPDGHVWPDTYVWPDSSVPTACAQQCTAQAEFMCVVHPASMLCVECLTDADCIGNPGAPGSRCDPTVNECLCVADTDCVGKTTGVRCNPQYQVCGCQSHGDCAGGRLCIGNFAGSPVCKAPCQSNADCAGNMFETVCSLQTGCQECVVPTDCGLASPGPYCNAGYCECLADWDCAGNLNGGICLPEGHMCGCVMDFHCPAGKTCSGQYVGNMICK